MQRSSLACLCCRSKWSVNTHLKCRWRLDNVFIGHGWWLKWNCSQQKHRYRNELFHGAALFRMTINSACEMKGYLFVQKARVSFGQHWFKGEVVWMNNTASTFFLAFSSFFFWQVDDDYDDNEKKKNWIRVSIGYWSRLRNILFKRKSDPYFDRCRLNWKASTKNIESRQRTSIFICVF